MPRRPEEGIELYLYSFYNLGARWGWMVNSMPRPLYPRERDPVPFVWEVGLAPGPVWTDVKILAHSHRDSILGPSSP
jgi:hypothetical protein